MTNEQLAVLLDGIQQELDSAIRETRAMIAEDRPKVHERRHQARELCLMPFCQNPDHFVEGAYDDPVNELAFLDEVSGSIGGRIDMLRQGKS